MPSFRFALSPQLSLRHVANGLPLTYTGADLYALCSDAMLQAITRRASAVDAKVRAINAKRAAARPSREVSSDEEAQSAPRQRMDIQPITVAYFFDHLATTEDTEVVVEQEDFDDAHRELVPSVSARELAHYARVRAAFERVEEGKENAEETARQTVNGAHSMRASHPGSDDDYVLRTEQLSLDPAKAKANGVTSKAKGKAPLLDNAGMDFGFGNVTDGDGELYDV